MSVQRVGTSITWSAPQSAPCSSRLIPAFPASSWKGPLRSQADDAAVEPAATPARVQAMPRRLPRGRARGVNNESRLWKTRRTGSPRISGGGRPVVRSVLQPEIHGRIVDALSYRRHQPNRARVPACAWSLNIDDVRGKRRRARTSRWCLLHVSFRPLPGPGQRRRTRRFPASAGGASGVSRRP